MDFGPEGAQATMNNCMDNCKELMVCDKCGKQLCKFDKLQDDTVIKKHCISAGCYRIGDETICVQCHTPGNR